MGPGHGVLPAQWVAKAGSLWDPCNWLLCGKEFGEACGRQHELEGASRAGEASQARPRGVLQLQVLGRFNPLHRGGHAPPRIPKR
eukprot:13789797-Alexandrium_andersonii.AAC.1